MAKMIKYRRLPISSTLFCAFRIFLLLKLSNHRNISHSIIRIHCKTKNQSQVKLEYTKFETKNKKCNNLVKFHTELK